MPAADGLDPEIMPVLQYGAETTVENWRDNANHR